MLRGNKCIVLVWPRTDLDDHSPRSPDLNLDFKFESCYKNVTFLDRRRACIGAASCLAINYNGLSPFGFAFKCCFVPSAYNFRTCVAFLSKLKMVRVGARKAFRGVKMAAGPGQFEIVAPRSSVYTFMNPEHCRGPQEWNCRVRSAFFISFAGSRFVSDGVGLDLHWIGGMAKFRSPCFPIKPCCAVINYSNQQGDLENMR